MSPLSFDFSHLSSTDAPWGPPQETPECLKFNDVPYAPFSKTDKLGKVADWQQNREEEQQTNKNTNQKKRDQYHAYGASAAKLFGAETEEEGFFVVDNATSVNKQTILKGKKHQQTANTKRRQPNEPNNNNNNNNNTNNNNNNNNNTNNNNNNSNNNNNNNNNNSNNNTRKSATPAPNATPRWGNNNRRMKEEQAKLREPSIKIDPEWQLVSDIEFNRLTKLNLTVPASEVLSSEGTIHQYQKKYESNKPELLTVTERTTVKSTTSEDPVIKQLASSSRAKVFATDMIISQLMCATKSSYSWDIIVTKKDGVIYFDKRAGSARLEVDENSSNAPADSTDSEINSPTKLSLEAGQINDAFVFNSLSQSSTTSLSNPESAFSSDKYIPRGYKYVKFSLPSGNKKRDDGEDDSLPVIIRSSIDSYTTTATSFVAIHALNQYNPTPSDDWKIKLNGGARGIIFADEIKKNNNKISQWATQATLAGVETMKIGFVSRQTPKSNTKHVVAGTMTFSSQVLSAQIKLSVNNGWGIVKSLVDIIDHEGGEGDYRFVIFRTPGYPKISIYKVPLTTFESELST